MRRRLQVLLLAYLVVLGVGVFGPEPGDELDDAARRLRDLQAELRDRVGDSSSTTATTAPPATVPASPPVSADAPATTAPAPAAPRPEPSWWDELRAEEVFNAAVFVPIGFLVPLCWPRLRWLTVLLGAQLSGLIELIQDRFLDWRSPTVNDVRWNTLGAVVGFGMWLALLLVAPALVRRLSADRSPAPGGEVP